MPLGIQGELLVGTAGTTPTVALNDDTKAEINTANTMVEWNSRGQPIFTSGYGGQKISMTFEAQKNNMNVSLQALQTAFQTRIPIAVKSLDKVGGYGVDADWNVASFKETQDKEGQDVIAIELALCLLYRAVTWINSSETASTDGF